MTVPQRSEQLSLDSCVAKIFIGDVTVTLQKGHIYCGTLVVTSKGFSVM